MPTLHNHLVARREPILSRWRELILATYPENAAQLMLRERDPFGNPVGHAVTESIGPLFDGVMAGRPPAELHGELDRLVRVRAVQDFTASQAVGFVFHLKRIIRDETDGPGVEPEWAGERLGLETRIDGLALATFDVYMSCRERIYELRANELKRSTHQLLKRAHSLEEGARTESHQEKGGS